MERFEQLRDDQLFAEIRRRTFLSSAGRLTMAGGLGSLALNSLWADEQTRSSASSNPLARVPRGVLKQFDHPPRCRRIIFLYMAGGPSHLETFDPKPELKKLHGKPFPESFTKGQQLAQLQGQKLIAFEPQFKFIKGGKSGNEITEIFPNITKVLDDVCIVRSMHTEQINHDPAHTFMNSGAIVSGRPSMGSWMLYGLGAETNDLPGYVVLSSKGRGGQMQPIASRQWSAGFLPSKYQGVAFASTGDPVLHLQNPPGVSRSLQERSIQAISKLNRANHQQTADPEAITRIAQYEMAFRMQASVPDLVDMSNESKETLNLYGCTPGDGSFASNCLLARRLAARGVRFIQLYHRDWDHHSNLRADIQLKAQEVDQATAALLTDLKRRGMLDETLVVFAGEFGRTPMSQSGNGRDHHIKAMSAMLFGGGIKGGITYGATDELGYASVVNKVSVHDLHATMLYLLGIEHTKLSVRFQGLDARLTGVEPARVVKEILS